MGITTDGIEGVALSLAGSALPKYGAIGTGTTAYVSGDTALETETDRNLISTIDVSIPEEITFITDFSPVEVSGLVLTEFGTMSTGSRLYNREVLTGSAVFTGEEELQLQQTFKFYI